MTTLQLNGYLVGLSLVALGAVGPWLAMSRVARILGVLSALAGASVAGLIALVETGESSAPLGLLLLGWALSVGLGILAAALASRPGRPVARTAWGWLAAVLALELWFALVVLWVATVSAGGV